MSKSSRGRAFIYSTNKPALSTNQQTRKRRRSPELAAKYGGEAAEGSIATGTHSGSHGFSSKLQKLADYEDDDFDDEIGTAAIEQYELTQRQRDHVTAPHTHTSPNAPSTSSTKVIGHTTQDQTTNPLTRTGSPDSLQQTVERLQIENYTKDGEVTLLRGEKERLLGELRKREEQMQHMQSMFTSEKTDLQTQLSKQNNALTAKLQFQEQEITSLREKCLLLEQSSKSPAASKPVPTSRPIKAAISSKNTSDIFLSSESFMPSSQMATIEATSVQVKPKRTPRERSVSISEKKPDTKTKKARVSRSPTTTPSDTLSGRRTQKSSKGSSPGSKPHTVTGVDPSLILTVPGRELDDTQLLMLLIRRDLLKPPVFVSSQEHEVLKEMPTDKDTQSSDEDSSESNSEDTHNSITGLLSLLQIQPKSKPSQFPGSITTPIRTLDSCSFSLSSTESPPTVSTPVRHTKLQLSKPHTLARMDLAGSRLEQVVSSQSQSQSLSASNILTQAEHDRKTSSLVHSVDKKGLEKSIGALLQSADLTSISRTEHTLSTTSFCPQKLHSRMTENSTLELLVRNIASTVLQYHADQTLKSKGTTNTITSLSDAGDTDSSLSAASHKSISSSGSSKTSSELFSPLKCDQQLVSQFLDILHTLVSYYQSVREQILFQPSKLSLDSRPESALSMSPSRSLLERASEKFRSTKTLKSVHTDLAEVSRRLSYTRERSATPDSPLRPAGDCRPSGEEWQWKGQELSNSHSTNLSSSVWTLKQVSPSQVRQLEQSFSLPESKMRLSEGGHLFNVLLEMPAPPWRESTQNIVTCLRILAALAEDCPVDSLQQFAPLLEDDVLGPCLDKDDPQIVHSTLSLLGHLVRSPVLVGLLCTSSPCVPINCYDICLQTLPDQEHRHSGYTGQLLVIRLISASLVAENGPSVLLTSSCQCTLELLKTLVMLLSNLLDGVHETSLWTSQELTLVLEVVSLMHKVSVHDNYFDSHLLECEHTYFYVLSTLTWLLPTHSTPLREVVMVSDLLEYAEELEDSEELDKVDITN